MILAPSRLLVLISASVRSPSRMSLSTLNLTRTFGPSRDTLVTSPILKPETCTAGLRRQTTDLLEVGGVLLGRVDERKLPERQRDQYGDRGQTDADRADDDGVALREELHFGVHRPVDWPATLT